MVSFARGLGPGALAWLLLGCTASAEDPSGGAAGVGAGGNAGAPGHAGRGAAAGEPGAGGTSAGRGGGGSHAGGRAGGLGGSSGLAGLGGLGSLGGLGGLGGSGSHECGCAGKPAAAGAPASGVPVVGGCAMFPPNDDWNRDVSSDSADAAWTLRLQNLVGNVKIHPDYGGDASALYGIPVGVVPQDQPLLPVTFDWYPEESDPGPYPFPSPAEALIEGGDAMNCDGDCHLLVVQQGSCQLYEGYACRWENGWHCGNGAHFDLTRVSYGQRPMGWTSADAAGLAIAPGIVRYDEVRAGAVNHAIRFTVDCTKGAFVKPASHEAVPGGCSDTDPNAPPMGLRVRLKADYDTSKAPAGAQVVLTAMKRYGMILADNGSNFYFQGEANLGWTEDDIEPLKGVPASAFEVVSVPPLME
jgi:hypothetical protein